jgi:hypothetical protein
MTMTQKERGNAARATRELTAAEKKLIGNLYLNKRNLPAAYVTTTTEVPLGSTDEQGPWGPNPARIAPAGTTLRIVMVSRMDDCGLTDNLDAEYGYDVRLPWESAAMTDIRLTKEPTR